MKKIICIIMVLACFYTTAFGYNDVKQNDYAQKEISVLSDLNIIKGDENGNFNPEMSITRAEFTAVIIRALAMEGTAKTITKSSFSDIKEGDWCVGYIEVAKEMKIIDGFEDNTFRAAQNVLYKEAIKMLVCALGYAPKFKDINDAYPTEYITQANVLGINKNTTSKIDEPASRSKCAVLLYNSLTAPLLEQISYGKNPEYQISETKTLLSNSLMIAQIEGTITKISDGKITVNVTKTDKAFESIKVGENEFKISKNIKSEEFLNKICSLYIDTSSEEFSIKSLYI